jgi:hypothetical protein
LREFEVGTKSKVVSYVSNYRPAKFGEFWTSERSPIRISIFRWMKIFKITKWSRAPLVTLTRRLTARVGHRRTRDTAHGDSTITVHRRGPPPHMEWSLPIRVLLAEGLVSHFLLPGAIPPLLCFTLLRGGSACRGQPPSSCSRRHPSRGKGSSLSPLPLAPSWSLSRWPSTPDEQVHRTAFFFRAGHHRPLLSEHLRPRHHFKKNLQSEPSSSSTHRRLSSPPLDLCGEPPSTLLQPMGFPWSRVSPRHHLVR